MLSSDRVAGYAEYDLMIHTGHEKKKLPARVRRICGQVDATKRGLQAEVELERIMHLLASTRAAMAA